MTMDNMGNEKKLVLGSFVFLFLTFAVMAVMMERNVAFSQYGDDYFNSESPVSVTQISDGSTNPTRLKAMIKGSIYETGENMTVYGACFNGDGFLLPDATGQFTAWFPNGTIAYGPNSTMDEILYDEKGNFFVNGTGRFKIHITMNDTIGTYLTEIRCVLDDEEAWAFGEWQNPEWVKRIGNTEIQVNDTFNLLTQVSNDIDIFRNDTAQNFSDVLSAISSINVTDELGEGLYEVREQIKSIDGNLWVLDETNPFFVLGSSTHNWAACDVLNENDVAAVSTDGFYANWDGETWIEFDLSSTGVEFRGVSILPANLPFVWAVGGNSTGPVVSINGANLSSVVLLGGSPAYFNDIKLFQRPNDPSSPFFGYMIGDDGSLYFTNNTGVNWTVRANITSGSVGRISKIVENYDSFAQPNGYVVMVGQGMQVVVDDGSGSPLIFNVTGTVKDVSLLFFDLGYVVVEGSINSSIYKWNGTGLFLEYTIENANIVPTAIDAVTMNDVWVVTQDPGTFYHFDGRKWAYSTVGYSGFVSVLVNFNGGGNDGIADACIKDSRVGYAVGNDGIILEWKSRYEQNFDSLFNLSGEINVTVNNIMDLVLDMNLTINAELDNIDSFLASMNSTLNFKLDSIISNVTFTNLYLTTTIFPILTTINASINNVLIQLNFIEGQVNQTLIISNETLIIVNETSIDVDELVNRSRRIRAWIIQ